MKRTIIAVIACVFLVGGSALAHHSYAEFFTDQIVSVEGDVEGFLYVNPHVLLKVRAENGHTYSAVWRSPMQLGREGIIGTTLKVGDRIIVSGSPARDADMRALSLIREVRRPVDGWRWTR